MMKPAHLAALPVSHVPCLSPAPALPLSMPPRDGRAGGVGRRFTTLRHVTLDGGRGVFSEKRLTNKPTGIPEQPARLSGVGRRPRHYKWGTVEREPGRSTQSSTREASSALAAAIPFQRNRRILLFPFSSPPLRDTDSRMDIRTSQMVRSSSPMESLEKQLSCPICLEMFTKPVVILPCQHNLCRGCASDLYDSRNPYHYSGGIFRCPTCRFEVVLDRHGVHGLQRNLLVENIIDIYKQQQEGSGGGGSTEVPLKTKDSQEPMCLEHEEERINIYCITCQVPTCSLCKVFGSHKDCEVQPLQNVYQNQKVELSNSIEMLMAGNSCLQVLLSQMEDSCKTVQDNSQRQKQTLGEKFDLLYAILEEKKGQLLEKIGQEQDEKVRFLRSLVQQHTEQLQASTKLMDEAVQTMEKSGVAEFLITAKQLIGQTKDAAKNSLLQRPEPGFEKMDHFTVDTEEVEAILAKMDFGADSDYEDADDEEEEEGE